MTLQVDAALASEGAKEGLVEGDDVAECIWRGFQAVDGVLLGDGMLYYERLLREALEFGIGCQYGRRPLFPVLEIGLFVVGAFDGPGSGCRHDFLCFNSQWW